MTGEAAQFWLSLLSLAENLGPVGHDDLWDIEQAEIDWFRSRVFEWFPKARAKGNLPQAGQDCYLPFFLEPTTQRIQGIRATIRGLPEEVFKLPGAPEGWCRGALLGGESSRQGGAMTEGRATRSKTMPKRARPRSESPPSPPPAAKRARWTSKRERRIVVMMASHGFSRKDAEARITYLDRQDVPLKPQLEVWNSLHKQAEAGYAARQAERETQAESAQGIEDPDQEDESGQAEPLAVLAIQPHLQDMVGAMRKESRETREGASSKELVSQESANQRPAEELAEYDREASASGESEEEEEGAEYPIQLLSIPEELISPMRSAKHKEYLKGAQLREFVRLPWTDSSLPRGRLLEFVINYSPEEKTTQVSGVDINLQYEDVCKAFRLKSGKDRVEQRVKGYTAITFLPSAKRDNGYLLSQCQCGLTQERLKFQRWALHGQEAKAEIGSAMVKQVEDIGLQRNWAMFFFNQFHLGLTWAQKSVETTGVSHWGSHVRIMILADQKAYPEKWATGLQRLAAKRAAAVEKRLGAEEAEEPLRILGPEPEGIPTGSQGEGSESPTREKA